jgi:DNA repair protein RadA/Sms
LGVITAVASSLRDVPIDPELVVFGEVGLTGEVRAVGQVETRLREAAKLGFRRCVLPLANCQAPEVAGIELSGVRTVAEALQVVLRHAACGMRNGRGGSCVVVSDWIIMRGW